MTLSTAARAEVLKLSTDTAVAYLLTVTHPDFAEPLRAVNAPLEVLVTDPFEAGVVSDGVTYSFFPFDFIAPLESETGGGQASIVFPDFEAASAGASNFRALLRSITGPVTVNASAISTVDVDAPEQVFAPMLARVTDIRGGFIQMELIAEDLSNEPLGYMTYDATRFRGLFP